MQETQAPDGTLAREFFRAQSQAEVIAKMDGRLSLLRAAGHTFVRRVKIGRNALCPCDSGRKFKKCCIAKVTPEQKIAERKVRG